MELSPNVARLRPSATIAVSSLAKKLVAEGRDIIDLSAGEPDFDTPGWIADAAIQGIREGRTRYTPAPGLPELRRAIARHLSHRAGQELDWNGVVVSSGAKQALFNACFSLFGPEDQVLVAAPYWTSYPEIVRLARAEPVPVAGAEERDFRLTPAELEAAAGPRTRGLILSTPSNPTGAVYSRSEVQEIGRWAHEHGIWVLTDEIYEHLVYGDATFSSMPVEVPELADSTVVVNGVAKTYAMTGWRVGWMIGPKDVVKAASSLQSHVTSNVSNVAQAAALAAVTGDLAAVEMMHEAFDRRRLTMLKMLNEIPGVDCIEPLGAFYAFPSFKEWMGKEVAGRTITNTVELAEVILDEARVAIVPGEGFGAPGYARLSYALGDDDLMEGVTRIADLLS
jgi:aspartate/methionine/tyrosine aminotransferase